MSDTLLCKDNDDACKCIEKFGRHISDWEFLPGGKIKLILDCKVEELGVKYRINRKGSANGR